MLSRVKKVFSNKSRKLTTNSKSNENCKTTSVVSVTSSLPDFTREFSTLTEQCGYVPTVLVNASKIIEAHIEDKHLFQTQGSIGKVDYLIQILGRDRRSVPRNTNIHDVVEAMKAYMYRKASPIVPEEIMTQLIDNHNSGDTERDIRIISQYRKMLPEVVPSVHFVLLLMNKVAKHSSANGMDERKLATIFVLDILKPLSVTATHGDCEKNRLERVQKLPYNIMVFEHLIRNVHIFEFAPYQQIHEPFSDIAEEHVWTPKDKQLHVFTTKQWKDQPALLSLDREVASSKIPIRNSINKQSLDSEVGLGSSSTPKCSKENTTIAAKALRGISPVKAVPSTKETLEKKSKDEAAKKQNGGISGLKTHNAGLGGHWKKKKPDTTETPAKPPSSGEVLKRDNAGGGGGGGNSGKLTQIEKNITSDRKNLVEGTTGSGYSSKLKKGTKIPHPSALKFGVVQYPSFGNKISPELTRKTIDTPTSLDDRKCSDSTSEVKKAMKYPHPSGLKCGAIQNPILGYKISPDATRKNIDTPEMTRKTIDTPTSLGDRKRSDSSSASRQLGHHREQQQQHQQHVSASRGGRAALIRTASSPPTFKRPAAPERPKTPAIASYGGYRPRSPCRFSPMNLTDIGKDSPKRPSFARSSTFRNLAPPNKGANKKAARAKETKNNKMFKKDEELQPWDGWITDSDDVSLIVRTTRNPKTFQFLEKYFMALGPNGSIEKLVFDAASSTQQEAQSHIKKRGRRNKNKGNGSSPRSKQNKGGSTSINNPSSSKSIKSTTAVKSGSGWSSTTRSKAGGVGTIYSSPELNSPREGKHGADNADVEEPDNACNVVSTLESTTRQSATSRICSSTEIDTQEGVKLKCRNSIQWGYSGNKPNSSSRQGKTKDLKKSNKDQTTVWGRVFDWVIDTSLMGIAIVCAAYIYNVL